VFFDDKRFWPIFERAQALDVAAHIHPSSPCRRRRCLLQGLSGQISAAPHGGLGLHRGDRHARHPHDPIGRIREASAPEDHPRASGRVAALLRLAHRHGALARADKPSTFRDSFCEHFWITTSGNFSTPALMCSIMEMGVDRILFSVDYPFVPKSAGNEWMADLPLSLEDRTKILSGNTKRLLRM